MHFYFLVANGQPVGRIFNLDTQLWIQLAVMILNMALLISIVVALIIFAVRGARRFLRWLKIRLE